jgi:uncharacterized membrane protein
VLTRHTDRALRIAIGCNAWFFFGFLYEEIVDVPNMMFGSRAASAQALWDPYHWVTNPVFYYVVVALPAVGSLVFLWLRRAELSPANRTRLQVAAGGHIAMALLTGIAVTQINGILYFGPPMGDPERVRTLAWVWFLVNALRITATALTVVKLVAIYTDTHKGLSGT